MSTTTDTTQVETTVYKALETFGADPAAINRDATFAELDVDSLDLAELSQIVEDDYGVKFTSSDVENLKSVGGLGTLEDNFGVLHDQGPEKVWPLAVPLMMGNAGSAAIAMRHDLRGPVFGIVSACAAGGNALATAVRMIQTGDADAVVTGGS